MDVKEVTAYECGKCHRVWGTKTDAEKCCAKGRCDSCGKELPNWWQHKCNACVSKEQWDSVDNAFVCASDYCEEVYYNGEYYATPDDVVDDLGEFPEWGVYGTYIEYVTLGDDSLQNWAQDMDLDELEVERGALDDFDKFVQWFNNKWAPYVRKADFSVSICRDDDPRGRA